MTGISTRMPGEVVFSFALVILSLVIFWQAYTISGFSSISSPGSLPLAASAIMVMSACFSFVKTLKKPLENHTLFFTHVLPPIVSIILAFILIYSVVLEKLGFIVSTFTFLVISIQFLYRKHFLITLGLALVSLITVYVVFRLIFQVILPEGIVPEREIIAAIRNLFS